MKYKELRRIQHDKWAKQQEEQEALYRERPLLAYSTRALREELKLRKKEGGTKARGK